MSDEIPESFKKEFLKLTKVLGYVAYSAFEKKDMSTHIHFFRKELKGAYEAYNGNYKRAMLCDYIYDATHYQWVKLRQPIPPLTETEKLIYGQT